MKIVYNISFFIMLCFHVSAQQGLEGIIVEKYYISNENDKAVDGDGGELPNNSVTYRVYVDMLPGYIFQAAYGVPEHELKISTTTKLTPETRHRITQSCLIHGCLLVLP